VIEQNFGSGPGRAGARDARRVRAKAVRQSFMDQSGFVRDEKRNADALSRDVACAAALIGAARRRDPRQVPAFRSARSASSRKVGSRSALFKLQTRQARTRLAKELDPPRARGMT